MSDALSPLEQRVLDLIQADFPLAADPYMEIGVQAGCTADEAYAAVMALRERGVIRRIGGSYAAVKLGYKGALVAARVQPEQLEATAAVVNSFNEVTHNYQRADQYNLWFTVIAEDMERVGAILTRVRDCPGVEAVYGLPAMRTFKINVKFRFAGGDDDA